MFVYLANELNSSLGLGSTIKWVKLKYYNNVVMNNLMSMRRNLSIYTYLYRLEIGLYKFVNKHKTSNHYL